MRLLPLLLTLSCFSATAQIDWSHTFGEAAAGEIPLQLRAMDDQSIVSLSALLTGQANEQQLVRRHISKAGILLRSDTLARTGEAWELIERTTTDTLPWVLVQPADPSDQRIYRWDPTSDQPLLALPKPDFKPTNGQLLPLADGDIFVVLTGIPRGTWGVQLMRLSPAGTPRWTQRYQGDLTATLLNDSRTAELPNGDLLTVAQTGGQYAMYRHGPMGDLRWGRSWSFPPDRSRPLLLDPLADGSFDLVCASYRGGQAAELVRFRFDASGEWLSNVPLALATNIVNLDIQLFRLPDGGGYRYAYHRRQGSTSYIDVRTVSLLGGSEPEYTYELDLLLDPVNPTWTTTASGRLYLTDQRTNADQRLGITILKLNSDSNAPNWTLDFSAGGAGAAEAALLVRSYPDGSAFVVTNTYAAGQRQDLLLLRYAADGTRIWATAYATAGFDQPQDAEVAPDGSVFLSVTQSTDTSCVAQVLILSPEGEIKHVVPVPVPQPAVATYQLARLAYDKGSDRCYVSAGFELGAVGHDGRYQSLYAIPQTAGRIVGRDIVVRTDGSVVTLLRTINTGMYRWLLRDSQGEYRLFNIHSLGFNTASREKILYPSGMNILLLGGSTLYHFNAQLQEKPSERRRGSLFVNNQLLPLANGRFISLRGSRAYFLDRNLDILFSFNLDGLTGLELHDVVGSVQDGFTVVGSVSSQFSTDAVVAHVSVERELPGETVSGFTPSIRIRRYPNPTPGPLTVEVLSNTGELIRLDLYDAQGRFLRTYTSATSVERYALRLYLADLPTGQYYLRASAGEEVTAEGFTVVD